MMQGYNQKNLHKKGDFINQQENFDENEQNNENVKKKSKRPCSFYRRGKCRDGDNCKFSHVDVVKFDKKKLSSKKQKKNNNDDNDNNNEQDNNNEEQDYDDNLQEGEEQNEQDNNEDNNDEDGEDNGDGEQKKNKSKKICIFFRRNNCKFGDNCKYLHIAGNYKKKSRSNRDNNAESSSTTIAHNNNNNNNNVSNNNNNNNNDVDENNNNQNNVDGEAVPGASNGEDVENLKYRTKPCRFFRRGHCNSGDDCPFLHVKGRNHNNNNNNNNSQNNNNNNNNQNNQRKSTEPFFQSESDNRNGNEEGNHDVNYQNNNNNNGDNNINNNNNAADGDNQQNDDPSKYRTKQCRYFRKGKCNSGDDCKFLHSTERVVKLNSNSINDSKSSSKEHNSNNNNDNNNNNINNNNNNINNTTGANATTPEVLDHRIRTKPCTYFRRGHCRSGDECLFLHVSDADARAMLKGNKKSKFEGNSKSNSNNTSQLRTFTIYSSNSDKKRTKEIQFPYEDTPIPADHQEDLDPYVILVSWEIRTQEFANHATIKRGLHDIFVENLGFYETHSQTVYEAEVSSLCSLLKIPLTDNENKILPALRSRLNHLIDAGLKPNNGLYGDYNAAATWLNTMYERGCDNQLTTPKEEAASLVMYIARRSAVFG